MRVQLPIHSYRLNSLPASAARLVNCYAELAPADSGHGPLILKRAPGIRAWADVGTGPGRGLHVMGDTLYAVSGSSLYRVDVDGTATDLGTIAGFGPCWLADNGIDLVIGIDSGAWYVYTGGALSAIGDDDFTSRGARACAFIDNYIVFVEPNSGRFFHSDLADATSYLALDFATAEGAPDNLVTLAVDHRELILFGTQTTERWYNASGGSGSPFERSPGGFMELGIRGVHAVCKLDNSVFWLASDLTIRRLDGNTPVRVSQHGIEERLRSMTTTDDCEASAYTFNGHLCAVFRFPTEEECFVYDATTQEWHERQSYLEVWQAVDTAEVYGNVVVQDAESGVVGIMDSATYTEWGDIQRCEWTYQNLYADGKRQFHSELEIVCETGVGLVTGQGSDPQLTLEVSNDAGRTWRTQATRSLGALGQYRQRVRWQRLGSARDRVYRCSLSDPVALTVWDTQLRTVAGE